MERGIMKMSKDQKKELEKMGIEITKTGDK